MPACDHPVMDAASARRSAMFIGVGSGAIGVARASVTVGDARVASVLVRAGS
jgi:hypothetical protein